jgi:hypothetical protein
MKKKKVFGPAKAFYRAERSCPGNQLVDPYEASSEKKKKIVHPVRKSMCSTVSNCIIAP